MNTASPALSPRHERFVAEFLRDGNATRAYLRAGYSPRGAQPSSARLMRRPDVAAAIAAGRQRLGRAAELSVERLAQEYARIAFATVDDFMVEGADGKLRVDLAKASAAQRAAIVEIRVRSNSKQEQEVTLKLGKMQALAALTKQVGLLVEPPEPGLTEEDRDRLERRNAELQHALDHSIQEQGRLERALRAARDRRAGSSDGVRQAWIPRDAGDDSEDLPVHGIPEHGWRHAPPDRHPGHGEGFRPSGLDDSRDPPPPSHVPGLYPDTRFVWSGGRASSMELDSAEALRRAPRGGFPGW